MCCFYHALVVLLHDTCCVTELTHLFSYACFCAADHEYGMKFVFVIVKLIMLFVEF